MKIIATTEDGCLIQASKNEVEEILSAVYGRKPESLNIGQKIPAIDYASTITKVKALNDAYRYKVMIEQIDSFIEEVAALKTAVEEAGTIEV